MMESRFTQMVKASKVVNMSITRQAGCYILHFYMFYTANKNQLPFLGLMLA